MDELWHGVVIRAWNNIKNKNLSLVAQQISNEWKERLWKNSRKFTIWTLITKPKYLTDTEQLIDLANVYYEFKISEHYVCIIVGSSQANDLRIWQAETIRSIIFKLNGFCAEQNIQTDNKYAPYSIPTHPTGPLLNLPLKPKK